MLRGLHREMALMANNERSVRFIWVDRGPPIDSQCNVCIYLFLENLVMTTLKQSRIDKLWKSLILPHIP